MKIIIKEAFLSILEIFKQYKNTLLFALGVLALTSQFTTINTYLLKNADTREIISISSNDAARAIKTATQTRWYNSNGFYPYGNVYFRLAHTINFLSPKNFLDENLSKNEIIEKSHHYSLMLTSLLCLYLLAYLFSSFFSLTTTVKLFLTYIFVGLFTQSEIWANYMLVAHPDHTLTLIVAIATYFTFLMMRFPKSKNHFTMAAIMWGIAMATKLTVILFLPAIFFLFLWDFKRLSLKNVFLFVLTMFFAYLLIGFPQNFAINRHIGFLLHQSHNSVSPDLESFMRWLSLTFHQIKYPLLGVFLFSIFFKSKAHNLPIKKSIIFVLIPFAILLSRKIMSVHDYYPMPFIALLLVGLVMLLSQLNLQNKFPVKLKYFVLIICFVLSASVLNQNMQKSFATSLNKNLTCRVEARQVNKMIKDYELQGVRVQVDPYFPAGTESQNIIRKWGYTRESMLNNDVDYIALRKNFYARYLSPAPSFLKSEEKDQWPKIGDYYRLFHNQESAQYKDTRWERIYSDECGFVIFKKLH